MHGPKPKPIDVTPRQRTVLEQVVRRTTGPQREVLRAKILLAMAAGGNNESVAERLGLHRDTVRLWRARWWAAHERLSAAEAALDDQELSELIRSVLDDAERSGRPATFTAEAICQMIAVACEEPEASGRPVTHWTPRELADEVIKREIVPRISPRSVGRFLKSGGFKTAPIPILADGPGGASGRLRRRSKTNL